MEYIKVEAFPREKPSKPAAKQMAPKEKRKGKRKIQELQKNACNQIRTVL